MHRIIAAASLALYLTTAQVSAAGTASDPCSGCGCCDCDGSGDVTINELITMVSIDLGYSLLSACAPAESECCLGDNTDQVSHIIACVGFALIGCPETPPTPTPILPPPTPTTTPP